MANPNDRTESREFQIGDAFVRVDHNTTHRPHGTREFNFRVRRAGKVTVYRIDVPEREVARMTPKQLAEYLAQREDRASRLFSYIDAAD